jgi:hypothetical protein
MPGAECIQRPAGDPVQNADIIDACNVVGMRMGEQHGVDARNAAGQQLGPQVWRRIDQQPRPHFTFHHDARARAAVARFGRIAMPPVAGAVRPTNEWYTG